MLKKSLGLFTGLLVSLAVVAAGAQLKPDHPDTYTVKKGDTLWDISAQFLKKPWLWPEIWRANPQVKNPHLIYPGDVLSLAYLGDGEGNQGSPYLKLEPGVRSSDLPATPPIALKDIKPYLQDMRVVDADTLKDAPYIMAFEENRLRGTPGQFAYARQLPDDAEPGQHFAIVRPTHAFRAFGSDEDRDVVAHRLDDNVGMVNGPWQEITRGDGHWGKGDSLGVEVAIIGDAMVQRGDDPTTMMIQSTTRAIRAGDRLLPVDDSPYDTAYYPHPPQDVPDGMSVIAFGNALHAVGSKQVVALSAGSADGVENGVTYAIFQPGKRVNDNVSSTHHHQHSVFGDKVQLPEEFVGHVMVFRTFDQVSYGLVMDAIRPVRLGDPLRMPE